jgi:hypothetical protein
VTWRDISSLLAESCGLTDICPHSSGASRGMSSKGLTWTKTPFRVQWKGVSCGGFKEAGVRSIVDEILCDREPFTQLATTPPTSENPSSRDCLINPNRLQIRVLGASRRGAKKPYLAVLAPEDARATSLSAIYQTVSLERLSGNSRTTRPMAIRTAETGHRRPVLALS